MISVRDLYREETKFPDHPGEYRDDETWRPFEVEKQTITVPGGADETLEIQHTVRRPVVNHLLPTVDTLDAPVSLRWIGAEVPLRPGRLARAPPRPLGQRRARDPAPLALPTSELRLRRRRRQHWLPRRRPGPLARARRVQPARRQRSGRPVERLLFV